MCNVLRSRSWKSGAAIKLLLPQRRGLDEQTSIVGQHRRIAPDFNGSQSADRLQQSHATCKPEIERPVEQLLAVCGQATARAAERKSGGIEWRNCQVMAIGLLPVCSRYSTGPRKRNGIDSPAMPWVLSRT